MAFATTDWLMAIAVEVGHTMFAWDALTPTRRPTPRAELPFQSSLKMASHLPIQNDGKTVAAIWPHGPLLFAMNLTQNCIAILELFLLLLKPLEHCWLVDEKAKFKFISTSYFMVKGVKHLCSFSAVRNGRTYRFL